MYLQGAKLQGGSYGALSPLDFSGLAYWFRTSDGITYQRSNIVGSWKDISGNNNLLTPANSTTLTNAAGQILNTPYGLGYYTTNTTYSLNAQGTPQNYVFIYDGSPFSIYIIERVIDVSTGQSGPLKYNTSDLSGGANNAGIRGSGGSTLSLRISGNNADLCSADGTNITSPGGYVNGNYFYEIQHLGYNVPGALSQFLNGLMRGQGSWIGAPANYTAPVATFGIQGALGRYVYEVVVFNQTGKTQAKIQDEKAKLFAKYFTPRYNGFFSSQSTVQYGFNTTSSKSTGLLTTIFSVANNDYSLTIPTNLVINYNITYVINGVTTTVNGKTATIAAGSMTVTQTIAIPDTTLLTKATVTITSISGAGAAYTATVINNL